MDNPDKTLVNLAIKNALTQNWKEAIRINQTLLKIESQNTETLNRLAYAYLKSGNIICSKSTYKKVLKVDKYNPIALKNLRWLENIDQNDIQCDPTISSTPTIFLEEPGKTKIIMLVDPAPAKILCNIITAQQVYLQARKHRIEIRNGKNIYIGALPDDISHRLLKFINAGNQYDAYIKNCSKNSVTVFVREIKKSSKYINFPSFPVSSFYAYQTDGEENTAVAHVKKTEVSEEY